jgi:hypothetical protein
VKGLCGTDRNTQATTHTAPGIHQADILQQGQRPKLAAIQAITAGGAHSVIYDGDKISLGNNRGNIELGYAAEHAAAARAAVSYVKIPVTIIPWRVHEPCILRLAQDAYGFRLVNGTSFLPSVECPLHGRKDQATLHRRIAAPADKLLLNAADAVAHTPRFGILQQFSGPFIGKDLDASGDRFFNRNDAVERGCEVGDCTLRLLKVLLEKLRKFFVNPG